MAPVATKDLEDTTADSVVNTNGEGSSSNTTNNQNSHLALSPIDQQERVWKELQRSNSNSCPQQQNGSDSKRTWPTYDEVLGHLKEADYTETLTCPYDTLSSAVSGTSSKTKTLCPHGVVCCADLEIFPNTPYTGLLQANQRSPCILRLSSAMKPPNLAVKSKFGRAMLYATGEKIRKAKLFPCAALKVFRPNCSSGNLLFGGSKVGQREHDYFAHCLCTSMTEQMPRTVRPFVRKFWSYSDFPLSLGVSDFCRHAPEDGARLADADLGFPFAVILRPCIVDRSHPHHHHAPLDTTTTAEATNNSNDTAFEDSFDEFLDRALHVPVGTVLYDVFACPEPEDVPDSSKLQRIGRLSTTSPMIQSSSTDGLFFRHQRKEEDYALRPSWPVALKAEVTINQGQTTGTIGRLAGWKLFEQHIAEGTYVDFEEPTQQQQQSS